MRASHLPDSATASALVARDLVKTYGDRVVLDGVDIVANPGGPLGVIGENGAGKSTLLRLLAGIESPDAGHVVRPPGLAYLAQEPDFGPATTLAAVLTDALRPMSDAAAHLERLAARLDDPSVAEEYVALLDWCELRDVWSAPRRAREAAERLGISAMTPDTPVSSMSGGQRSRLALAAMVAGRPPCVLLDEPTNHLDDEAVSVLESFVAELPGVAVVASHDRAFLEAVCHQIVDLDRSHVGTDGRGGSRFSGSYVDYLAAKERARRRWQDAFEAQRDELARLRDSRTATAVRIGHNRLPRDNDRFIHHFKGEGVERTASRRVRDVDQRILTIERELIPEPPTRLSFAGLGGDDLVRGGTVRVRDVVVAGRVAVPRLDVEPGEHLLVTGPNGSGKSTLLKLLAGLVVPSRGRVEVTARRVGYLPQYVTFSRPELTARQIYDGLTRRGLGSRAGMDAPAALEESGLLHPADLSQPVGHLSLGQHRRLALALLVAQQPDLLLLDEPTNHISLALAEELEKSLSETRITVVVASHDRWLRRRWDGGRLAL